MFQTFDFISFLSNHRWGTAACMLNLNKTIKYLAKWHFKNGSCSALMQFCFCEEHMGFRLAHKLNFSKNSIQGSLPVFL